jgi:hypothetical protein
MTPTPESIKLIADHNARIAEILETHQAVMGADLARVVDLTGMAQTMHALGHIVISASVACPDKAEYFNAVWCGNMQRFQDRLTGALTHGMSLTNKQRAEIDRNANTLADMSADVFDKLAEMAINQGE